MHITAITLSYDQVARIIEAYINAELLRTPHRVTRVDPWDWDAADEHQFAISLDPLPQQTAAAQRERVLAMLRIGGNREAIAEACGVAVSAVYRIRASAIAAGQLDAA